MRMDEPAAGLRSHDGCGPAVEVIVDGQSVLDEVLGVLAAVHARDRQGAAALLRLATFEAGRHHVHVNAKIGQLGGEVRDMGAKSADHVGWKLPRKYQDVHASWRVVIMKSP